MTNTSKWAKLKNPLGSALALLLLGVGRSCLAQWLSKDVEQKCYYHSCISWNLQFSCNFEGFVRISKVSDKPWNSFGTLEHLLAFSDAESCVCSAKSSQILQNHDSLSHKPNADTSVQGGVIQWTLSGAEGRLATSVPVLRNSAHTDQCYRQQMHLAQNEWRRKGEFSGIDKA